MDGQKYLIDTNVFIELEDNHEISPELSALTSLAGKHGVGLFVHEAARDDIGRDKNMKRRAISLSKVDKFQLLGKVHGLSEDQLSRAFGPLSKPNDVVDATLLILFNGRGRFALMFFRSILIIEFPTREFEMRSRRSLSQRIMEHAEALPEAVPLCPAALLHLGNRAAVDQALSCLARSG